LKSGKIKETLDLKISDELASVKDAFPVRIEVTKLPETGSRYEIIKN